MNNEIPSVEYQQLYTEPFNTHDYVRITELLSQSAEELFYLNFKVISPSRFVQIVRENLLIVARLPEGRIVGCAFLARRETLSSPDDRSIEDVIVDKGVGHRDAIRKGLVQEILRRTRSRGFHIRIPADCMEVTFSPSNLGSVGK